MCTREIGYCVRVGNLADQAKECRLLVCFLGVGRLQQIAHAEALFLRGDDFEHRGL
jgi:hypothetical protein